MKKKDLIQLIKTKSEQVELRDFSKEIIEKAKHFPQREVIEKTKFAFRLKPYYLATLGVMLTVFMIFLFTPDSPINPIDPTLENMDQVIAFSTLTSVSLIETFDSNLLTSDEQSFLLQGGPDTPFRARRIDAQIPNITKYLEMMEKLFGSESDFGIVNELPNHPSYQQRIRFRTKDLLDEESEYAIDFNQSTIGVHGFLIEGVVLVGEYAYPIYASGTSNDQNSLELMIEREDGAKIKIDYQKTDDFHDFEIEIYQGDTLIQSVDFTYIQEGENKRAALDFVYGSSTGSYTFTLDVTEQMKLIRISYDLDAEDSESGEITIRIRTTLGNPMYIILVKPDGGIPFIINSERQMGPRMANQSHISEKVEI